MCEVRAEDYRRFDPGLFCQCQEADGGFHVGMEKLWISGFFWSVPFVHASSEDQGVVTPQKTEQFIVCGGFWVYDDNSTSRGMKVCG